MPDVKLDYAPRLANLRRLGGEADADLPRLQGLESADLERRRSGSRSNPAELFAGRAGYDAGFLEGFPVVLPKPLCIRADDVLQVDGSRDGRLDYTHFSVVMSKSRRLAMFVAVNIEGQSSRKIERGDDQWFLDGRIPPEAQIGEELYVGNDLDRGHLVRREDPNWGEEAETANDDTFHFTNCTPQMAGFNQKTWLGLENYILHNTRKWRERVTVFTGPVFGSNDLLYRGVRIPLAYWKVVSFLTDDGRPSASAYMIDQEREIGSLEAAFGRYKTYQRSVRYISELTLLDFGNLAQYDGFSNEEAQGGVRIEAVLRTLGDIRV
ncbi:DNA/RNA non-specific endonuclease [Methylorubrum thiocyanatum]|uniref:DNA/RNA non-specific endonuclease n=1 Tax=Methylorubrum thiocyanatum TaxID=47958 RepID=UPI00364C580A